MLIAQLVHIFHPWISKRQKWQKTDYVGTYSGSDTCRLYAVRCVGAVQSDRRGPAEDLLLRHSIGRRQRTAIQFSPSRICGWNVRNGDRWRNWNTRQSFRCTLWTTSDETTRKQPAEYGLLNEFKVANATLYTAYRILLDQCCCPWKADWKDNFVRLIHWKATHLLVMH